MDTAWNCAFCRHDALEVVLAETPHFLLLADHAPLVEGHLLIVPREHLACYGALPEDREPEFLALKGRVAAFLRSAYAEPTFFEHGVFHQTVFHAHLHAFPFGDVRLALPDLTTARLSRSLADLRAWYDQRGHYFYLEPPTPRDQSHAEDPTSALGHIFPPDEGVYFPTLFALRQASSSPASWAPSPLRRITGRDKMARVAAAWKEYNRHHEPTDAADL